MANDVDEFVVTTCMKYKMSPLAFSGLLLARMTKMAKDIDYLGEHEKLLKTVLDKIYEDSSTTVQSNQIH
jgi:hypothetical protein